MVTHRLPFNTTCSEVPGLGKDMVIFVEGNNFQLPISLKLGTAQLGFPGGSDSKESACSARDLGLIPG